MSMEKQRFLSGKGHLSVENIDLSGPKSIEGRSIVIRNDTTLKVCSTVEADVEYVTAFANFPATIGGSVVFRQQLDKPDADTFMYLNLYWVSLNRETEPLDWQINNGIVSMDVEATTTLENRCSTTIGNLYNPTLANEVGCSVDNQSPCSIGNLTGKHGNVTIIRMSPFKAFYTDQNLPLKGKNSIIGKTIAFRKGNKYVGCANIIQYPSKHGEAMFSDDGVSGSVIMSQQSPLDVAVIKLNLTNLGNKAGGYHVHVWPVPVKTSAGGHCSDSDVSGHFNPFNVNVNNNYPALNSTTPDRYEVGDFSGKFGSLANMNTVVKNFFDPTLQLFGKNSILGRSLVIHYASDGSRWICSTIRHKENVQMTTAYAKFTYPVIGMLVLRQPKDQWYADTQIYVELDYGTDSSTTTVNHNWHVHQYLAGPDFMAQESRCSSAGAHFNPYGVDMSSNYSIECNSEKPFRCELGDLSGKHGNVNIRKSSGGKQKYFFTDIQLPLTGPLSIIGKSLTIHTENNGSPRLSCANIIERKNKVVEVSKWQASKGQGTPTGKVIISQDAIACLSGISTVTVQLSGLISGLDNFHIHEFPTATVVADKVCQADDVGGHMNPFKANFPYAGATPGTHDMYEVGDLSGKYSPITTTTYSASVNDKTVELDGPYSVAGRSVVIHKGAQRWACGNLVEVSDRGIMVAARADFTGDVMGYVYMEQYHYPNGDKSPTLIVVELSYLNSTDHITNKDVTADHNWHVHESRVAPGDKTCMSCGPHYNPYKVDLNNGYTQCSMDNPLRCEVGDQSGKMGKYDIGRGKRAFTDVNLDLEGQFSAGKRSVVFHVANGGAGRLACADLVPTGMSAMSYDMAFLLTNYDRTEVEESVALSLNTAIDNVHAVPLLDGVSCSHVRVYFLGKDKGTLKAQFEDVMISNNHAHLGRFTPHVRCMTSKMSRELVSIVLMLLCLLVSKLR
ncbi:uncharacterized protein LOC127843264 [Dreissena polymorpha]|nr:uncharacterized protein LOC127843264 [Dreissena polymorpha]